MSISRSKIFGRKKKRTENEKIVGDHGRSMGGHVRSVGSWEVTGGSWEVSEWSWEVSGRLKGGHNRSPGGC